MTVDEKRVMRRYQTIIGCLGWALPVLSVGFGLIGFFRGVNEPGWYESISATYYANSSMMMVGLLFAISLYFWAYKGYDRVDNSITKISAIAAMGIVAFPCADGQATSAEIVGLFCLPTALSGKIHTILAVVLYVTFFIQIQRFKKGKKHMTEQKKKRNRVYNWCMLLMLIGFAIIILSIVDKTLLPYHFLVLVGECFLQVGFGTAWLVKSESIKALNDDAPQED